MTFKNNKNNIGWIDALRILSCYMVVLAHCCDAFVGSFDTDRTAFLTGVFTGSLMRPCVPLFVMMTGALLLPFKQEETLNGFYKKRLGRLVVPFITWCVVPPLLFYIYFCYINPDTANPLINAEAYTASDAIRKIYTSVFNFNYDTTPLWYLYMLAGLYLAMPIVNGWLQSASKKEIETVLGIWVASLFVPYIKMVAPMLGYSGNYGNGGILGECDWNIYGTFYYLSGFMGYAILAYYLRKYPLQWSPSKMLAICLPMFIAGYAVTSFGYIKTNELYPGNYAYLEILWYFCGINVFMMTFPIFVAVQKINCASRAWLSNVASLTFGVFLSHFFFIYPIYDLFDCDTLPHILRILGMSIVTFIVTLAFVWLLSKNRITAKTIK